MELTLEVVKEWLRVDEEIENDKIVSIIFSSESIIKQATGLSFENASNDLQISELFKLTQKILITNLYENPQGFEENKTLTSLYIQLESYKNKLVLEGDINGN